MTTIPITFWTYTDSSSHLIVNSRAAFVAGASSTPIPKGETVSTLGGSSAGPIPTTSPSTPASSTPPTTPSFTPLAVSTISTSTSSSITNKQSTDTSSSADQSTSSASHEGSPGASTTSTALSPSLGGNETSAASAAAATSNSEPRATNSTGFIAGVAVLAALLLFTLVALVFLVLRQQKARKGRDKYSPADETKTVPSSPGNGLESTIATLEAQLHEKNTQLQKAQASLLRQGHRLDEYAIDDRRIHERFSQLSKSINDWVVAHFKILGPEISATPESLLLLKESQPNYAMLLRSPRTKYLVIRELVGDIILRAFTTGELLGSPAFCEIKKAIEAKSSATATSEWRASTASLLGKTLEYQAGKATSIQELSKRIESATANLAGLHYSEARFQHIRHVVEAAAELALDLMRQVPLFKVEKPMGKTFDAAKMEDVLQDSKSEVLHGRLIIGVIFPMVSKWGDDSGNNGGHGVTIYKAQVLV